eukprot:c26548_g1_i1 orf=192-353(+)
MTMFWSTSERLSLSLHLSFNIFHLIKAIFSTLDEWMVLERVKPSEMEEMFPRL